MRSTPSNWTGILAKLGFTRSKRNNRRQLSCFTRRLRMEPLENRRVLAVITVDTSIDERDFDILDGDVSLRDAVGAAVAGDTIDFDLAIMNGETIDLLSNLGEIAFSKTLTIDASMLSNGLTIDAGDGADGVVGNGDGFRIFNITGSSNTVTMEGLTLTGGDARVAVYALAA